VHYLVKNPRAATGRDPKSPARKISIPVIQHAVAIDWTPFSNPYNVGVWSSRMILTDEHVFFCAPFDDV